MAVVVFGATASANAAAIIWTLSGVTFDDGATLSGTFTTDPTTGLVTSVGTFTVTGGTLSAFTYDSADSFLYPVRDYVNPNSFIVVTNDLSRYVNLAFDNPLNIAGVDPLTLASLSDFGSYECTNCGVFRNVVRGFATGVFVPEPAAWVLMLIGLGGVGAGLRKARQRQALSAV
jgi:hypothetical protein